MRLIFALVLVLCAAHSQATERFPLAPQIALAERAAKGASTAPTDQAWKLGLLGLAALSFLIRKRL
jgi:hypothetical protein